VTRLLLVRHAESDWNAQGRWQGVADPPLSPRGVEQAVLAGPLVRPFGLTAVVSSDLQRARATADLLAPALALVGPPDVEPGLREYDLGAWSGLTRAEIEAGWPGEIEAWREGRLFATPGGEERDAFVARISRAVARVAADHAGQTVLVVTHGGVISALSRELGGPLRRFRHLSGIWVEGEPDRLRAGTVVELLDPDLGAAGSGEGTELAGVSDAPAG
jgi:broad specificity phosphatase PhoE